jgi:hypothetical protein
MVEKRETDRIAFVTMGRINEEIACTVENVSDRGALINMIDPIQKRLQQGDIIRLRIILLAPVEYLAKVVRVGVARIAVRFLG